MQKNVLKLFLTFFVIMGIGVFVYAKFCTPAQARCTTDSQPNTTNSSTIELAQNYFVYSPTTLAYAQEKGKTVLYFWAPWCSTCSSLDTELQKEGNQIPADVTILRVDYDTAKELKRKYAITIQHTFVQIDKNGNALKTWVGGEIELLKKNLQ